MSKLFLGLNVEPGATFVDVGVNLGQTLLKVKESLPGLRYVGFEPNPACVAYVEELLRFNKFENATVIAAGVGQVSSVAELYSSAGADVDAGATLIPGFRSQKQSTRSQPVCLLGKEQIENYLGKLSIGVIKIDVEGAELDVLLAFAHIIQRQRPTIILEVLPNYGGENKARLARQREIEGFLQAQNYKIFELKRQTDGRLSCEKASDFGLHSDLMSCDYVLLHSSQSEPCLAPMRCGLGDR